MSTAWFEKVAGMDMAASMDDPACMWVGDQTPDWVRMPDALGGARVPVLERFTAGCPCRTCGTVEHLRLPDNLGVAECLSRSAYLWYRTTPSEEENA
jgi:hypothetical protein